MGNDLDKPFNPTCRWYKQMNINNNIKIHIPLSINDSFHIENTKLTNPNVNEIILPSSKDKINIHEQLYYPFNNNDADITTTLPLSYENITQTQKDKIVFRIDRFSIKHNTFTNIKQEVYDICPKVKLFYYRTLFHEVTIDLNDEFIIAFVNHIELLPEELCDFFNNKLIEHLVNYRHIKKDIFNFEKLIQIVKSDFQMNYNLFNYVRVYMKFISRDNFVGIIAKMLSEEGELYSYLSQPNQHIYICFFYLIVLYIMSKRTYHNNTDNCIYMLIPHDYLDIRNTFHIGNIITNEMNFISCTKSIEYINSLCNNNDNVSILEIQCLERNEKYSYLNSNEFDLSRISLFKKEKEVIIKPLSYFEINDININDNTNSLYIKCTMLSNFYSQLLMANLSSEMKIKLGVCDDNFILNNNNNSIIDEQVDLTKICSITFNNKTHIMNNSFNLGCMKNLYSLDISNSNINDNDLIYLTPYILNLTNLKYLNLSQNCLTSVSISFFVETFKMLTNLEMLNLNQNELCDEGIIELSSQIENLKRLKHLSLVYNKIKYYGLMSLSKKLPLLKRLTHLNLSSNFIFYEEMNSFITSMNNLPLLTYLNISNNQIMSDGLVLISNKLNKMNNLQYINISENCIKTKGFIAFTENIKHCPNLKSLILYGNQIGANGIQSLVDNLHYVNKLRELNIGFNILGDNEIKILSEGLIHIPYIQIINLRENSITKDGVKCLLLYCSVLKYLHTLDLSWNQIEGCSCFYDFKDVVKNVNVLTYIKLENNPIKPADYKTLLHLLKGIEPSWYLNKENYIKKNNEIDYENIISKYIEKTGCSKIEELIITNKNISLLSNLHEYMNLKSLNISKQKLGLHSLNNNNLLTNLLSIGNNLLHLNLKGNNLNNEGIQLISTNLFDTLINIQTLNLSDNNISYEGISVFSENYYKIKSTLKCLNLNSNLLNDDGIACLSKCDFANIEIIKLKRNNIGMDGIAHFIMLFVYMHCLVRLDLNENNLGSDGISLLTKKLNELKLLRRLNVAKNKIKDDENVMKSFCDVIGKMVYLEKMFIGGNEIGDCGGGELLKYLMRSNVVKEMEIGGNMFSGGLERKFRLLAEEKQIKIDI